MFRGGLKAWRLGALETRSIVSMDDRSKRVCSRPPGLHASKPRWMAIALLLLARSAFAQTPAIPKVEFDDAVQRALASNPTVAQAAVAIPRAEALVAQARALTRPTVNASFGNTTLDSARGFDGGITQPQNQSTLSADLTVPVLNLARRAAVPQARDQVEVAQFTTATVRRDIAVATAQAYLAVIAARRQVDVDQRALDSAAAHVDYAQKRLQGGSGTRLNELRAAGAASLAATRLEGSRLAVRRAQEALGALIVANGPADAGAEPGFDIPATVNDEDWMKGRPDMQAQMAAQRAAEHIVRDSWRDSVGTASVSFAPQYIAPKGLFQPNGTWRLGFVIFAARLRGRTAKGGTPAPRAAGRADKAGAVGRRAPRAIGDSRRPGVGKELRARARERPPVGDPGERRASDHDVGLRGRRDDEHRGDRRSAVGARCRDAGGAAGRRAQAREAGSARGDWEISEISREPEAGTFGPRGSRFSPATTPTRLG